MSEPTTGEGKYNSVWVILHSYNTVIIFAGASTNLAAQVIPAIIVIIVILVVIIFVFGAVLYRNQYKKRRSIDFYHRPSSATSKDYWFEVEENVVRYAHYLLQISLIDY